MFKFFVQQLIMVFLLTPLSVSAGVYKYIDDAGKIHYSDQPFIYKQKNFKQGDDSSTIDANLLKYDKKLLYGIWDLNGYSMHRSSGKISDEGKWSFDEDGFVTTQTGDNINKTQFRTHGKLVEVIESEHWVPYSVIALSDNHLTIKNESNGKYLYFKRNKIIKEVTKPIKAHYRRKQVVDLIIYFTCLDVKFENMSDSEKEQVYGEIFELTGIKHFDETVFTHSIDKYKDDDIYLEKHKPRINKEVEACRKTNVVPKFFIDE